MNLIETLLDGKRKNVILDTDTYNEVDDQYALAYAMLSPEKVNLLAVTVAPFKNSRAATPAEGMEKSYAEAHHIRGLVDEKSALPIYRGSTTYLPDKNTPVVSEAAETIVRLAKECTEPLYVVAVGAITNVASALLMAPEIAEKIVVIWLGGHALHWKHNHEFNLRQDVPAAQVVFERAKNFVQIPCAGVCTEFATSVPELQYHIGGKNALCDYLLELTANYNKSHENTAVWSKVIWDVTAVAAITAPETLDMVQIPRPVVTDNENYAFDMGNPHYVYVRRISRDALYTDLFQKLTNQ
ncbi:MAG: nucleoside hydrolase [Ruminococcaceae bacterium]|nr:nucleoside hydrolase [Oscillospiraceae bacterium]